MKRIFKLRVKDQIKGPSHHIFERKPKHFSGNHFATVSLNGISNFSHSNSIKYNCSSMTLVRSIIF